MSLHTLERFFGAFGVGDGDTMASCYHPRASFFDPVFGPLKAERVGAMWRMLMRSADELDLSVTETWSDGRSGTARWTAVYPFGATGRVVKNEVRSSFDFEDELFVRHVDAFAFYRWSRQALGPVGTAFGWTPVFRRRVRMLANSQLDRYLH
jgi:hypothetical protein